MDDPLREFCIAYARFNASRSLATAEPSEFEVRKLGGATLLLDPARPGGSLYNRLLDFDALSTNHLAEILQHYEHTRDGPQIDLSPEADCELVLSALQREGFRQTYELAYLTKSIDRPQQAPNIPIHSATADVEVQRWDHDRADDFLNLLKSSGVGCSDRIWQLRREHYCTERFRSYILLHDRRPCGWSTMFIEGNAGYLANAYTQPELRGLGCQSRLIDARVADGIALGLDSLVSDVLPETTSHRNLIRAGFVLNKIDAIWQRPHE